MPSPFQGIDIASSALAAYTQAMNVVSNNIANVNTTGYTREVATFNSDPTSLIYAGKPIQIGNGVNISSVSGVRDTYLNSQMQTLASQIGQTNSQLSGSQQIQSQFNEPGTSGIQNAMDTFFNSWSSLASDPSNGALLSQVQLAGETLASRVQGTYQNLSGLQTQNTQQVNDT
ncbi:MAG: FlgK family flagellar hook-associated protein, partial [Rhabdochlamydiaceae bacterium]